MSIGPFSKDILGRPSYHAADCICEDCRAAEHKKSLLSELATARAAGILLSKTLTLVTAERDEAREEVERKQAALVELIACKDLKHAIENTDFGHWLTEDEWSEYHASQEEYARRKPLAWSAARRAVLPSVLPDAKEGN